MSTRAKLCTRPVIGLNVLLGLFSCMLMVYHYVDRKDNVCTVQQYFSSLLDKVVICDFTKP